MITLITGAPGTGKSNAFVSLLQELTKERAAYVNGIPELLVPHIVLEDPTKWHEVVPDGSDIGIDEAQNFFRPRGPGQKVPDHVSKLETHRHRGLNLYLITQGPNLLDANVRALVGRHVHLRDLGILGRWWYEWPECADNCRTGWKNAPIKKRYKLDKAAQAKYKSASIHVKPVRSVPWMLAVMVLALCIVAFMSWRAYGMISAKVNPPKPASTAVASGQVNGASGAPTASASTPKTIDDRIAWIPRISHRPESAPAFDDLRKVAVMPVVSGAICNSKGCRCVTQQGTNAGLSDAECRAWLENPPFDPYSAMKAEHAPSPSAGRENAPEARPAPGMVLIEAPGYRDPVGARSSPR